MRLADPQLGGLGDFGRGSEGAQGHDQLNSRRSLPLIQLRLPVQWQ